MPQPRKAVPVDPVVERQQRIDAAMLTPGARENIMSRKRMTRPIIALALIVPLVLWGCRGRSNPVTAENYKRIEGGMTEDQVRAILGDPDKTQKAQLGRAGQETTVWEYGRGDRWIAVYFRFGQVTAKREEGLGVGDQFFPNYYQ